MNLAGESSTFLIKFMIEPSQLNRQIKWLLSVCLIAEADYLTHRADLIGAIRIVLIISSNRSSHPSG